jgi:putative RNA 2'-phosphotransferase
MENLKYLSKTISKALRHNPDSLGLILDEYGRVDVEILINALNNQHPDWSVTLVNLISMINSSEKKRFDIDNGLIRCTYGHSINIISLAELQEPPEFLYHGSAWHLLKRITITEGLKPMGRIKVHLSSDVETAYKVALRKTKKPMLLKVHSYEAFIQSGIEFFLTNDTTWLSNEIPPQFIEVIQE